MKIRVAKDAFAELDDLMEGASEVEEESEEELSVHEEIESMIPSEVSVKHKRLSKRPLTAVAINILGTLAYTADKAGNITAWDLSTMSVRWKRPSLGLSHPSGHPALKSFSKMPNRGPIEGHYGAVMSLSVSHDSVLLASGGKDKILALWDAETGAPVESFAMYRDTILSVRFAPNNRSLFTTCADRTIRLYDTDDKVLVQNMYGHQSAVLDIAVLNDNRAASIAHDGSVRVWRPAQESQLVFRPDHNPDGVAMIDSQTFLSIGEGGQLCLWTTAKKKPIATINIAIDGAWLTAIKYLPEMNAAIVGDARGHVMLVDVSPGQRSMEVRRVLEVPGVVTGIAAAGDKVVVSVSREHRLGRWEALKGFTNGLARIYFKAE